MDRRSLFAGSLATIAGLRLSLASPLFLCLGRVLSGRPGVLGWAPQSPAAGGRAQSRAPRVGPGAGAPANPIRRPPGLSKRALPLLQVPREDRDARNFLPPPALYPAFSATRPRWGALATLCAPVALGAGGGSAFSPRQLSPTSCGRPGAAVRGRFYTVRPTPGTRWVSGVFLDGCLPLYFCLPLPLSLSVSDSDSFSGSPHPLRVSLFLFHSLSPCFSWDVPVCLLFCLFRCLSVLPYFLFLFLTLAACLSLPLLSLLPGPPEHHQLPDPEAPCPGEHTPAHLLGTSRYRDLQVRRPP